MLRKLRKYDTAIKFRQSKVCKKKLRHTYFVMGCIKCSSYDHINVKLMDIAGLSKEWTRRSRLYTSFIHVKISRQILSVH